MTTDANVDQKDALPSGQPSQDKQEPSAPLEVLKSQVDKAADARHSKLDKQVSTLTKSEATAVKRAEDAEARVTQIQKEKDETELEDAKGDPEALRSIQRQRTIRQREAQATLKERELDERESKVKPLEERVSQTERKDLADEVAAEFGVDASALLEHSDGSREKMEALAKVLPKKSLPESTPDSGLTIGGEPMPDSAKSKMRAGFDDLHK